MEEESKKRKRPSGAIRDKERTKDKMVQAVGKVLLKKGYANLNASTVAKEAGVDKSLVWTYFGNLDNLVEKYISQRDFWKFTAQDSINSLLTSSTGIQKEQISTLLQNQFETLLNDGVLQKIIHWEIGENKSFLRNLADEREAIGEELFKLTLPQFEGSKINMRAITALLIGGIYYLSLHGKINGSTFCGLDVNSTKDKDLINQAIEDILFWAFNNVSKKTEN